MSHKKILVIRLSSIGDLVLTNFIYKALKEKYPNSEIHVLTKKEYADVIRYNPFIDKLILFNKKQSFCMLIKNIKKENFNLIIDLHNNLRSNILKLSVKSQHLTYKKESWKRLLLVKTKINLLKKKKTILEKYASTIGIKNNISNFIVIPEFIINKLESRLIDNEFKQGHFITISKEARWSTKQWDKFESLIEQLLKQKKRVVVIGKKNSGMKFNSSLFLDLSGQLSLIESAAVIKLSSQFIGNDTGLMHIADALKVPLITIWGPTVQEFGFSPQSKESHIVEINDLNCRPCSTHGSKICPKGHFKCMKMISVDMVSKYVK